MHPEKKMLTFNPFRDIPDLDTLPQYESLRNMLDMQYSQEEGAAIYRTYSGGILPPQDEIAAFSRMNEGGATWYVSAVLPYSSVRRLIDKNVGQFEDMDEIFKAGTRAKEIVDQLLPFSRRETDSSAYGPVSLEAVLRDVTKMVSMILPASIRLETDFADLHANVFGSATQLHQVFLNLCSNAVQAMEPDGGVLTIRARRIAPDALPAQLAQGVHGDCVRVAVSDTGCGIAPETLPHIFDTFFTTKQAGEGTGLGLSVVQNILISHGGCIEARSTPGEGSEFLVFLPLTALTVPVRPSKAPPRRRRLPVQDPSCSSTTSAWRGISHGGCAARVIPSICSRTPSRRWTPFRARPAAGI